MEYYIKREVKVCIIKLIVNLRNAFLWIKATKLNIL